MFLPIIMAATVSNAAIVEENDIYISETAHEAYVEYGEQYNICPELLMVIIEAEIRKRRNIKLRRWDFREKRRT